jgi:hexosaminidase
MKLFSLIILTIITESLQAQMVSAKYLIPEPVSVIEQPGSYLVSEEIPIKFAIEFKAAADLFVAAIKNSEWKTNKKGQSRKLNAGLQINKYVGSRIADANKYTIIIKETGIYIQAGSKLSAIQAVQSLVQLILLQPDKNVIPCCVINDYPQFSYRGLMLDVSRNFFSVSYVKKLISVLSFYKLNNLHLHLADDAGWRLAIDQYPALTRQAAWRSQKTWKDWWKGDRSYAIEASPTAFGGYYSKNDIRALIQYASDRGINIIPEIEFPAHSGEVIAMYPQLGCLGVSDKQSEFCLGNDSTYIFFENVLKEVFALFPSTYIHIGGDEASTGHWKKCSRCQEMMRLHQLKDEQALQSYAIKKIAAFIKAYGKKMIGWDEIVEGGLADDATVMSWRGEAGGIKAAQMKHDVIMTPGGYLYLDAYQQDPATQPEAIGGYLPIKKLYNYYPVPAKMDTTQQSHFIGLQGNLWTEYIPDETQADYMLFPRLLALSEIAWRDKDRNWDKFHERLQMQYPLLKKWQINYCPPSPQVSIDAKIDIATAKASITLSSEQWQPNIFYTLDGTTPNTLSHPYKGPFVVNSTAQLRAGIITNEKLQGTPAAYNIDMHKALGKKVNYLQKYNSSYPAAGTASLTDGQKGGLTYGDGFWQGFTNDIELVIDLEKEMEIQEVRANFMQLTGPGVYMPLFTAISVSNDGIHYTDPQKDVNTINEKDPALIFKTFKMQVNGWRGRYLKFFAKNQAGFLFVDEVVVE